VSLRKEIEPRVLSAKLLQISWNPLENIMIEQKDLTYQELLDQASRDQSSKFELAVYALQACEAAATAEDRVWIEKKSRDGVAVSTAALYDAEAVALGLEPLLLRKGLGQSDSIFEFWREIAPLSAKRRYADLVRESF
jgi:hypothetical protein